MVVVVGTRRRTTTGFLSQDVNMCSDVVASLQTKCNVLNVTVRQHKVNDAKYLERDTRKWKEQAGSLLSVDHVD